MTDQDIGLIRRLPSADAVQSQAQVGEDLTSAPEQLSHLSPDPQLNLKRSDPFQFGTRFLQENDDVYAFNAWDHVETDDVYKEYAEIQYAKQREFPVSEFDKSRFNSEPAKWWNIFYKNNTSNFFKNRKWLQQEFPVLSNVTDANAGHMTLLEVGAGAGNTAFPILVNNQNPLLKIHACDFSKSAVQLIREHESYDTRHIQADVWDVAGENLPPGLDEETVDIVLMIFIFSALSPNQWQQSVHNIYRLLRPGGEVLFRDYGRGDLAQVRFKKGRYMQDNFYVRGDGTRVYFFEKDELAHIWAGQDNQQSGPSKGTTDDRSDKFEIVDLAVDRRLLVNRAKQLKMHRCWMQGRFYKPEVHDDNVPTSQIK